MARKNPIIEAAEREIKKLEDAGDLPDDVSDAGTPSGDVVAADGEVELDLADGTTTVVEDGDQPSTSAEVEVAADVLDAFIEWAKTDVEADLQPFIEAGLLDKRQSLSDAGVRVLDDEKIGWRTMYFIKIGVQLGLSDGTKLMSGSSLLILNGGTDEKQGSKYWLVFAGENLPTLTVYQHRLHQFWDAKYPLAQKITAKYTRAE